MRIVMTSDTHGKHRKLNLPKGDILIHAGDMTNIGEIEQFKDFNTWMGEQDFPLGKFAVAGNHDTTLDLPIEGVLSGPESLPRRVKLEDVVKGRREEWREKIKSLFTNFTYLENFGAEVNGFKIWGSPYTPFFSSEFWRFHTRSGEERSRMWATIPEGLDVLITHGPPRHILGHTMEGDDAGDLELYDRVRRLMNRPPKLHVFGHIHEGYGKSYAASRLTQENGTNFVNASFMTRAYQPLNQPWVWDTETGQITNLDTESSL